MVAISFSLFKDKLLSGEKDQTIRPLTEHRYKQMRKAWFNAQIGIPDLQIYWKQRTKECEKLFDAFLKDMFVIYIDPDEESIAKRDAPHLYRVFTDDEVEEVIRRDGFDSKEDFFNFFRKKYGSKLKDMYFILIRFRRAEGER